MGDRELTAQDLATDGPVEDWAPVPPVDPSRTRAPGARPLDLSCSACGGRHEKLRGAAGRFACLGARLRFLDVPAPKIWTRRPGRV